MYDYFDVNAGDIRRVILHWTAGGPNPSSVDLRAYHALIDSGGRVVPGKFDISDNISTSDGIYAAHTLSANTKAAGISLCGMRGATESNLDYGPNPINEVQFREAARLTAHLLWQAGLPCEPHTALSHAEVESTLGIKQRNKWDISVLPWRSDIRGARAVGDYWRGMIREELKKMGPVEEYVSDPVTTLRQGNRTPLAQVRVLQQMLMDHGYFQGSKDGLFGPRTKASVMAFQDANGLTADGVVGPLTWQALHRADKKPERPVAMTDLADSRTIKTAETVQKSGITLASAGSVLAVAETLTDAEATISSAQSMLYAYWPVALFAGVGFAAWRYGGRIKAFRLDDAVTGRHLGR